MAEVRFKLRHSQNEKRADKNSLKQLNIMDRIGVNLPIFV